MSSQREISHPSSLCQVKQLTRRASMAPETGSSASSPLRGVEDQTQLHATLYNLSSPKMKATTKQGGVRASHSRIDRGEEWLVIVFVKRVDMDYTILALQAIHLG